MVDSRAANASPRTGLARVMFWSAGAVLATALSFGCGGGNDPDTYDVTVSVVSSTDLGSLHFKIYSFFNDGDFIGHGDDLDCTVLVDADLESDKFGGDPPFGPILELWLSNEDGFAVPSAVVRCGFRTAEEIRDDSFAVEFLDATNFTGSPTEATITISSVERRD